MSHRSPNSDEINTNRTSAVVEPEYSNRYTFAFKGLRPNTRHDLYLNNQLYNFAAIPFGKNIGDSIISDSNGTVKVVILAEDSYKLAAAERENFTTPFNTLMTNQQKDKREKKVIRMYDDFFLTSVDGKSSCTMRIYRDLLTRN